jgi:hypothetical protein
MALQVIGSGLGRTGTMSTKLALEQLGLRCHHMVEVFMNPQSIPLWIDAGNGKPDWDAIFDGYAAMVDHPGCAYWRELMDFYPDAKVLHTVRDPDKWFDSTQATIFNPDRPFPAEGPMLAGVPKDRLLVFNVAEGWGPLCAFLGVPVPDTPYPRENSTEQFVARQDAIRDPETAKAIFQADIKRS